MSEDIIKSTLLSIINAGAGRTQEERIAAIIALGNYSIDNKKCIPFFIQIIETKIGKSKEERLAAISVLGNVGGNEAQDFLIKIINSKPKYNKEERIAAINALGYIRSF
ncbi:HEAT repeat domain-containing protein [Acinetobacter gerneri]|uniref:HEAT repeat domain-containing protein n=1 Tax=Acinetobacter gerneri DSM 14967 = CIP 107464 = MTCC 9824 TaxID=1120926 RepID=N8ZH01_9GAMM|nr:HEAT repeat domain-containing protein [Acinetobacter gerneri]ENV33014.1 hypothetical protein F960_02736 [Acinetobacter gerneri DSM 14967 = CIP 107464 = MTCC 9824]EPR80214.1 hypothetical protein L289_0902 [Acinetobacter gerneri DSM 14967 = CIP 107464 = MTCC 9824]